METPKPDITTTTNKGGAFLNCLDLTKVCFGCMQVEDLKACSGFCRGKTVQRGIILYCLRLISFTNISLLKAVQILRSLSLDDEKMMEVPLISFWKLHALSTTV